MKHFVFALTVLLATLALSRTANAAEPSRHIDRSAAAPEVVLATGGKALLDIVIPADASKELTVTATELAGYLQQVTGATFQVKNAPAEKGILLGKATDFPALKLEQTLPLKEPEDREHYLVRTQPQRLLLIGATDHAAGHAAYHFLERIGCRWFFPNTNWEVLPTIKELRVKLDLDERPDYVMRSIWGRGMFAGEVGERWKRQNRMAYLIHINAGHFYESVIRLNKAEFDKHPEYRSLINGERDTRTGQFCISNPGLRNLVVQHALKIFKEKPDQESISAEPMDNTRWCECEPCVKMGAPSDRVVFLANQVAEEVNKAYPGKFVGFYAYSNHAAPPNIPLHPRVYPLLATSFTGGYGIDGLIQGWGPKAKNLGVREYFSVYLWDWALPASGQASSPQYMADKLPYFFKNRINALSAESSDSWGPQGLGYYTAVKLMWNVETDAHALIEDFMTRAFGKAAPAMREFYTLNDPRNKPRRGDDHMGRLFRCLAKARQLETDPKVVARVDDLTLWLTYADLYTAYDGEKDPAKRKTAAEAVVRFVWKIRDTHMVSISMWGNLRGNQLLGMSRGDRTPNLSGKELEEYDKSLKPTETFTHAEIVKMNEEGVKRHTVIDFTVAVYSKNLAPARLPGTDQPRTRTVLATRNVLYLMANDDGTLPTLYASIGEQRGVKTPFNEMTWTLSRLDGVVLEQGVMPENATEYAFPFKTKGKGLYRFVYSTGRTPATLHWDGGARVMLCAGEEQPATLHINKRGNYYFYVPKGTKTVVLYGREFQPCTFYDASGKLVHTNKDKLSDHIAIPVGPGQDGQAWRVNNLHGGGVMLLTVPPYLALAPDELLVPAEVMGAGK